MFDRYVSQVGRCHSLAVLAILPTFLPDPLGVFFVTQARSLPDQRHDCRLGFGGWCGYTLETATYNSRA